jgi:glycosyltransferase involved in cell wall biosynthesis
MPSKLFTEAKEALLTVIGGNEPLLTVIMPIYNEEEALPEILPKVISHCDEHGWRLILINDGSKDKTATILSNYYDYPGVKVIHHKVNQGYGAALKTGLKAVSTKYVVSIDADGQHDLNDIETLFKLALEQDADLVIGKRTGEVNPNLYRAFGKVLIRNFAKLLMPIPIHDLNSGFKLYRTDLAQKYLTICPNGMAFSDVITLVFINQRDLVVETPITILKRLNGTSTINLQTAFDTVMEIINITLLFNPLKIFFSLFLGCFLFGIVWGIPFLIMGRGVSVGAMLAIVTGLLFLAIGMIANQLSAIRIAFMNKN